MSDIKAERQKICDDLVAIRAGLSYISDLRGEKEAIERDISSRKKKIDSKRGDIRDIKREIEDQKNHIQQKHHELSNLNDKKKNAEKTLEDSKNKVVGKEGKGFLIGFSFICALIVLTIIFYAIVQYSLFNNIVKYVLLGVLVIVVSAFFIIQLNGYKSKNAKLAKSNSDTIKSNEGNVESISDEISRTYKAIDKLEKDYPIFEEEKEDAIREIEDEIEEIQNEIEELDIERDSKCDIAKKTYDALVDRYGETLHTSDWYNLDRLLYYISTNRADTIKEALNALDLKINNELLINEIKENTSMIVGEMNRANSIMFQTITGCAKALSESISDMKYSVRKAIKDSTEEISGKIDASTSASLSMQAEMVNTNRRLISSQDLTNSLIRNGNKTMQELLDDYKFINRVDPVTGMYRS